MAFEPPPVFNIADYFLGDRIREGRAERVALRIGDATLTYGEVEALANRFAHALRDLGVRREERVIIALPDGAEYVGALFGILRLGAVVVMVNPEVPAENLAALLDLTGATAAVVGNAAVEVFESAMANSANDRPLLLVVGETHPRHRAFDQGLPAVFDTVRTNRDDPAIWLFSGGTTGTPKAVVQTHTSFANTTERYAKETLGYRESDITLAVPKLYFGYATGSNLFFPFAVGASAALFPEHPTAEVLFREIRRHRPTILVNVPTMVNQMVGHPEAGSQDLSSLRLATSAGEALPPALYARWKQTFGVELLDGLGTAEMWHIFVTNRPGAVRPGTLGQAVPGFEVRVCDDDGNELPDGEVGLLWVRGNSRAIGYWRDMGRTAAAFRGEWFVGGDLVSKDADGYVTYTGRGDDALKVGGKWLVPAEVEGCLIEHPAVIECAVVGVPDAAGLVKPVAFVVAAEPEPGLADELKQHALDRLDAYKHPRRIVLLEEFPKTHLGKVDRRKLRELAG